MKSITLLIAFSLLTNLCIAQQTGLSKAQLTGRELAETLKVKGYQTSVDNWTIHIGDTLKLGKGTFPDRKFTFIYDRYNLGSRYDYSGNLVKNHLPSDYAGLSVVVKDLYLSGTRKTGFTVSALVGVGTLVRSLVEVDNAIDAGEILPPVQFRKVPASVPAAPSASVADELLKLKSLLDAGALTQAEYDAQKKKLLSQ